MHALDDCIIDLVVRGVPPPCEHVGLCEYFFGEPVLRLVEGRDPGRYVGAELSPDPIGDRTVHAVRVDPFDRIIAQLVDMLVPDGDPKLAAARHQLAAAAPVALPVV